MTIILHFSNNFANTILLSIRKIYRNNLTWIIKDIKFEMQEYLEIHDKRSAVWNLSNLGR